MKTILLVILSLVFVHQKADPLNPVDDVSSVKFSVKNFGFAVTGGFKGLAGAIKFDPNDLPNSSIDVSIDANTINTGIDMRDEHLRGESYFDVKNYPRIHFLSTRLTRSNKAGTFFVFGNLTIKQTTKEISFPFSAHPQDDGYMFNGEFKLNRRDYHIGGSGTISNEVVVKLEVVAKK
jgi:polyisoprenoid-binding protein YceI